MVLFKMSSDASSEPTTTENPYAYTEYIPMTPWVQIPAAICIACLIFMALAGNALTIISFIRDKRLRTVYDLYIFNLAITDMAVGCVSMPLYSTYTLREFIWTFGPGLCKGFLSIDFTACVESTFMMIILSFDRLLLMTYGPHYHAKMTMKKAVITIVVSWILAIIFYAPAILFWDYWVGYSTVPENDCGMEFAFNFEYTTTMAFLEFLIPVISLAVINFLIYKKIYNRLQKNKIQPVSKNVATIEIKPNIISVNEEPSNVPSTSNTAHANDQKSGLSREQTRTRRENKAARFLAILVLVFLLTWMPYTLITVITSFCAEACINLSIYEAANWLLWSKAAFNPVLYALNSEKYRSNFKKIVFFWKK